MGRGEAGVVSIGMHTSHSSDKALPLIGAERRRSAVVADAEAPPLPGFPSKVQREDNNNQMCWPNELCNSCFSCAIALVIVELVLYELLHSFCGSLPM